MVGRVAFETVLLVGGLGTRLRSELGDLPKPMVDIGGQPFLERVILHLRSYQVRRFILAVGYGREAIEQYFGDGAFLDVSIEYSRETQPLGTAGAVRNTFPLLREHQVLVLNGDSFADIDYDDLLTFHRAQGGPLTLAAVYKPDCRDFGRVQIFDNRVTSFREKLHSDNTPGHINTGVYVFERGLIETIPAGIVQSLEQQVFPSLLERGGKIQAFCTDRYFMDLGTPQRLRQLRSDFLRGVIPFRCGIGLVRTRRS